MQWRKDCKNVFILLTFILKTNSVFSAVLENKINEIYFQKLVDNLNTSVDPCDNFYEYACGNWAQNYAATEFVDMPGYMDHKVNKQLLEILETHKSKKGIYEKVWRNYQSCLDLTNPALNYYLKLVQRELKLEWPIFRADWSSPWVNETNFDWLSTAGILRTYGLNGVFLTQNINVRVTNGSHFVLEVHQHQPRLWLTQKDVAELFLNFGMTPEESDRVTTPIIELEVTMKNLTKVEFTIESEEDDDKYQEAFKEMSIKELAEKVPSIDWEKYFHVVLGDDWDFGKLIVQTFSLNLEYFNQLQKILQKTSNETICNYLMLKFMYQLNDDLPNVSDRSLRCIKYLRGYMPLGMNYLYEQHLYKAKRKSIDGAIFDIYDKLRSNFKKLVEENYLDLNATEKSYILEELNTMQLKIGNIPDELTQAFVEQYYEAVKINASNFYANHLALLKLHTRQQQFKLHNFYVPPGLRFYEHDVETASSSSPVKIFDNAVLVPYGYLQLPLFHQDASSLFQYSLFGFILAHEIIHAYDLFHIVYDQHGNYNSMGLAISKHFWKHIDCFVQSTTDNLSENIADIAGLRLAYQSYFDDVVNNAEHADFKFSSINFTNEQLFFISSVQFLCANMPKVASLDLSTFNLEHDMHDIRVLQNWASFEKFASAFKCSEGSNMNPNQKCRLW